MRIFHLFTYKSARSEHMWRFADLEGTERSAEKEVGAFLQTPTERSGGVEEAPKMAAARVNDIPVIRAAADL